MAAHVQQMLYSFDLLAKVDKREVASEILHRTLMLDVPPLSDEQIVNSADELFLQLDRSEAADAS